MIVIRKIIQQSVLLTVTAKHFSNLKTRDYLTYLQQKIKERKMAENISDVGKFGNKNETATKNLKDYGKYTEKTSFNPLKNQRNSIFGVAQGRNYF